MPLILLKSNLICITVADQSINPDYCQN